ncbi:SGNH/GDSL hydrolase family protein [Streptomyces sp. NPDC000880]
MKQPPITRRRLLQVAGIGGAALAAPAALNLSPAAAQARTDSSQSTLIDVTPTVENGVAWYEVAQWGVEGKAWQDTERFYDRLPARARSTVRPEVWNLSHDSAGMLTRFETDSTVFHARYRLNSSTLSLPQMPATGASGLDLYARTSSGVDRWLAGTIPATQFVEQRLVTGVDPGRRLYTAYLPLYNGVESLQIGVDPGASFQGVQPRAERPAVFYGTSIMQGGVASRPGMSITAILGRRFDCPTINLGFRGNGTMDLPVGELLTEIDASVYVIDCLPNLTPAMVAERTEPLVRLLRATRPDTPILLVEDRTYANATFVESSRQQQAGSRAALHAAYMNLRTSGVKHLFYLEGDHLVGDDGEGEVEGSHPSDLGMFRYCDAYQRVLRPFLASQ